MAVSLDYLKQILQSNKNEYDICSNVEESSNKDIAVIGISCRFAEANSKEEYWKVLEEGKNCIRDFPENRIDDLKTYVEHLRIPSEDHMYYKGGFLDEIDKFDYDFYSISPTEAKLMSPEQRIFLETAWHAIEDAGYGGKKLAGTKTGVFVGHSTDFGQNYKSLIEVLAPEQAGISIPGNLNSIIAGRISYLLDLKGPCMLIDTACSSALASIHMACRSLRNSECEMAIAGAIKIDLLPLCKMRQKEEELGIAAADGITRAFDQDSGGTGLGEGVAAVLLKPLGKAVRDNDNIYAVIKGSALNQDGKSIGLTAPNSIAQEEVILSAWRDAGINPETVAYIEAHGTGTKLGDPIEINGIQRAFRRFADKVQFCAVGSVKTNIGHTDNASGMAGFIKAVLSLYMKKIPPTLNLDKPNKNINFIDSPVFINDRLRDWKAGDFLRRCGVSAFGLSGTNCHVVLEEAPKQGGDSNLEYDSEDRLINVLTLSAKSKNSLAQLVQQYVKYLVSEPGSDLKSLCYTANTGRGHHPFRLAIVFQNYQDLLNKLINASSSDLSQADLIKIFYGEHKIVSDLMPARNDRDITEEQKRHMSKASECIIGEIHQKCESIEQCDELIKELCNLYVQGADIDWEEYYKFKSLKKVSLPVYPFERKVCWIDRKDLKDLKVDSGYSNTEKNFYYRMVWKEKELQVPVKGIYEDIILVIRADADLYESYLDALRGEAKEVIDAVYGDEFLRICRDRYTIGGTFEDYNRLLSELKDRGITKILYFGSSADKNPVQELSEFEEEMKRGIYSLFYLTKALLSNRISKNLDIVVIADYASEVTGSEVSVNPHSAALFGVSKVVGLEYDKLQCRCIDIDRYTDIKKVLREIGSYKSEHIAAYRKGTRYVEELQKAVIDNSVDEKVKISEEGVYIITGGTGELGLQACKFLASKNSVNLALINRSPFPERRYWEQIIQEGKDIELCNKIKTIREIETNATKVLFFSADVSDPDKMSDIINYLKSTLKRINGVIHCAGVAGDGFIMNKDKSTFDSVIRPKLQGTWILDKLTSDAELDFFVVFSSTTSFIAEAGQSDYTSANCYLDSYTHSRNRTGRRTLTINWPAWKEIGMAVKYGANNKEDVFKPISTADALKAFGQVLDKNIGRIIIGEINPNALHNSKWKEHLGAFGALTSYECEISDNPLEISTSGNVEEYTPDQYKERVTLSGIERKIAGLWADVLGRAEIDPQERFFDMGGDSILASFLLRAMEKEFPGLVDITDIYTYPTVQKMSQYMETKTQREETVTCLQTQSYEDELDELLDKLAKGEITKKQIRNMK